LRSRSRSSSWSRRDVALTATVVAEPIVELLDGEARAALEHSQVAVVGVRGGSVSTGPCHELRDDLLREVLALALAGNGRCISAKVVALYACLRSLIMLRRFQRFGSGVRLGNMENRHDL